MSSLSVIVNTKNSAKYLRESLQSVVAIADEIIVVDMASTDETLQIAKEFDKVKIFQYPEPEIGYADPAREFAFGKASGEWLLIHDSDEELPARLAKTIRKIVDGKKISNIDKAEIYYLPRRNEIFGHFMVDTGWYPDYQLRLWQKGKIEWRAGVHSQPKIHGTTAYLPSDEPESQAIIHHNYQSVDQYLQRVIKYTSAAAAEKTHTCSAKKLSPADFWEAFWHEFYRRAFRDRGILEGSHGVVLSLLQSTYELIVLAKVWEAQGFAESEFTLSRLDKLRKTGRRELAYWWADVMTAQTTGMAQLYWRVRRKMKI